MVRLSVGGAKDKTVRVLAGAGLLIGALAILITPSPARGQVDPAGEWETLHTEHFAITYPAGQERVAQRAAVRGEAAWIALAAFLPEPDVHEVELLLTGDVDFSNGFARAAPAPRITVYLRPPVDGFALSSMDDWLDLVIVHELAHVFHLDASGPLGGFLRTLLGRVPLTWPFFPGSGTPEWTIEGLAVWVESRVTGSGRAATPFFQMMLRTAALEDFFATVDRASGRSPQWPAGEQSYLYGGLFFQYLLDTYGVESLGAFVEAVAGQWIPYRLNSAAKTAFGVSFSDAWDAWTVEQAEQARAVVAALEADGPLTVPEHRTTDGRVVAYPAVSPGGDIAFARSDGRTDPQLRLVGAGGEERFLRRTHGLSRPAWTRSGELIFAQPDFTNRWTIRSDLWRMEVGGRARRITSGARLDHPSPYPDARRAVAVQYTEDGSTLVQVDLGSGQVTPLSALPSGGTWAFPSVSPDGRRVAATWWDGTGADVVIVDGEDGRVLHRVTDDAAQDLTPVWSPDGRWLLWGSDRTGVLQLHAVRVDAATGEPGPRRQITRVATGAAFPAVDPVGGWIWFSHYTSLGWELARIPLDPSTWSDPMPAAVHASREPNEPARALPRTGTGARAGQESDRVTGYRALPSLQPRFWSPVILPGEDAGDGYVVRPFVGASTRATDLIGRHTLDMRAALSLSGEQFLGSLRYSWAGLGNPVLDVALSQGWDGTGPFFAQRADSLPPEALYIRERERRLSVGMTLVRQRWTNSVGLGLRGGLVWERRELLDGAYRISDAFSLNRPSNRLAEIQATLSVSNVRGHALSTGAEEGASLTVLARGLRELSLDGSLRAQPGLDRSRSEFIGVGRVFQSFSGPGYGDHVVGLRASAATASGPGADAFLYDVGGASGQTDPLTEFGLLGGEQYLFPVRGWENGVRSGRYAWSASGEYRFPLGILNRGLGLFPLHLDRLSGTLFGDAGNAWGPEFGIPGFERPRGSAIWSAGAEVSARLNLFFNVPLFLRTGVVPFRGEGGTRLSGSPIWYVRFGPTF